MLIVIIIINFFGYCVHNKKKSNERKRLFVLMKTQISVSEAIILISSLS